MAKFLTAKLASLAAVISSAAILSGCGTSSERPVVCEPGIEDPRCPKVKKAQAPVAPDKRKSGKSNY